MVISQGKKLVEWSTPHPDNEEYVDYDVTDLGVLLRTFPDNEAIDEEYEYECGKWRYYRS